MHRSLLSSKCEQAFEWMRWVKEIPYLSFPAGWNVKVIPPFAGAVVRFLVQRPDSDECISVYLDCYNSLGFFGNPPQPYWEIYPVTQKDEGDVYTDVCRFAMSETDALIRCIQSQIQHEVWMGE